MKVTSDKINGVLGILGGMGPMATVDFVKKIIEQTPAECDQDHIPLVIYSVPQIPDRSQCIAEANDAPLEWLVTGVNILRDSGAQSIAIPCNTAHFWYTPLQKHCDIPILHIVDAAANALVSRGICSGRIGLLATTGTIKANIYQERLSKLGYSCILPSPRLQKEAVMTGIAEVKAGNYGIAQHLLEKAAKYLVTSGCEIIMLGCTEIPIVLKGNAYLDATEALARAAVTSHLQSKGKTRLPVNSNTYPSKTKVRLD